MEVVVREWLLGVPAPSTLHIRLQQEDLRERWELW